MEVHTLAKPFKQRCIFTNFRTLQRKHEKMPLKTPRTTSLPRPTPLSGRNQWGTYEHQIIAVGQRALVVNAYPAWERYIFYHVNLGASQESLQYRFSCLGWLGTQDNILSMVRHSLHFVAT